MNINNKIFIIIISFFLLFFGYKKYFKKSFLIKEKNNLPLIVCTTSIIGSILSELSSNFARIEVLMGPGVDPHLYKAKSGDIYLLNDADLIFYNGLHLEGKMVEILEGLTSRGKFSYAVTESLESEMLRESEYKGMYDPHVWFDVILWKEVTIYIASCLKKHFPEQKNEINLNCEKLLFELEELHNYTIQKISEIPERKRVLISAHDAFGYFGKRYGLVVEGLQGISTDAEIRVEDIERVAQTVMQYDIKTIFIEQTVPEKYIKGIQELVKINNKDVFIGDKLYSDALGEKGSGAETYITMFYKNVDSIIKGLSL